MRRGSLLFIGVFASAAVCLQNAGFSLSFGWGLIHGAPAAVLSLVPVALGLAGVWIGYWMLRRSNVPYQPALFTAYALAIVLLNEVLLPATPLKSWRYERDLKRIEVRNMRDDVYGSRSGKPAGIRITFDVIFPETVVCDVSTSTLVPLSGEPRSAFQFSRRYQYDVQPAPAREGGYHVFRQRTRYTITEITLPNFLSFDADTGEPCLQPIVNDTFSEADFLSALARKEPEKYRTAVVVVSERLTNTIIATEYVTSREYDVNAMYQTIVAEGSRRCGS